MAKALGMWDVNKMLSEMPLDMFNYWVAFLGKEKRKHTKQDYQLALIAKLVAEKDTKANNPLKNYMITFKSKLEQEADAIQEDEELFNKLCSFGGVIKPLDE